MPTKTQTQPKGASVDVRSHETGEQAFTADFIRRGMHTFEQVNESLHRVETELNRLQSFGANGAGQNIGTTPTTYPGAWGNRPNLASGWQSPVAWPVAPFDGQAMPGASYPSFGQYGANLPPRASGETAFTPFGAQTTTQFTGQHRTGTSRYGFLPLEVLRDAPPRERMPACDIVDDGEVYQIRMELPGVNKDNIDIICYSNCLVVSANVSVPFEEGALLLGESGNIVYRRTIDLPSDVETDKCKANLQNGILALEVAKQVPTTPSRRINVA